MHKHQPQADYEDSTAINDRIARLERDVRCWRRISATCAGLLVVLIGTAAMQDRDWSKSVAPGNNAEYDVVTAKTVRIVNMFGTPVVTLAADAQGNGLIALAAGMGKPTAMITADKESRGLIALIGEGTNRIVEAGANNDGDGTLTVRDRTGKVVSILPRDPTPSGRKNASDEQGATKPAEVPTPDGKND